MSKITDNKQEYLCLITADGYYCEYCGEYHEKILYRSIIEYLGEYEGRDIEIKSTIELCPSCRREDLTKFTATKWTLLQAYNNKTPLPITYIFPVYDNIENCLPSAWNETTNAEVVEKAAGEWCIEITELYFDEEIDQIKIKVDFV